MTRKVVYLDNAATTFPKPESVLYEMYKCAREYSGNPGRGSNSLAIKASEIVYECRESLCKLFNAPNEESVILTMNATYALNTAIKCFLPRGCHVLISDIEHNAVYRPIVAEAIAGNISFDIFSSYEGDKNKILDDIQRKTKRNTKAIICTAASNVCNLALPISEIGRYANEKRLIFIVDASQMAGHRAIDMRSSYISIICAPAHKGLYGPQGTGIMVLNDIMPKRTIIEGGSGVNSKDIRMPPNLPEMLEAGTLCTQNARALTESVRYLLSAGIDNIEKYEYGLSQAMTEMLTHHSSLHLHGNYNSGGVFSVTSDKYNTTELASALDEHGIMVRAGLHCAPLAHKKLGTLKDGTVRFSLGIFNTHSDIEYLDSVLDIIKA